MIPFFRRRLQLQLLLILLAVVSVAAVSVLLILDSLRNAERSVIADMGSQLNAALSELGRQYFERTNSDIAWPDLVPSARNVSLRAISQAVLRSYPEVEGGYYVNSRFLGYSFPTHDNPSAKTDVPEAERLIIQRVVSESKARGEVSELLHGGNELVLIRAVTLPQPNAAVWAMQRRSFEPSNGARRALLLGLVIAALLCVGGTLRMGFVLHRGVAGIQNGLTVLEKDFGCLLEEGEDELGEISKSINRMARVRRTLEDDLRREDRMRAIGRTVAGIAHEIRNPLNGIRLSLQLLEERIKRCSVRATDVSLAIGEVDRLDSILKDLLAFKGQNRPVLAEQAVFPILEKCIHLLEPQAVAGRFRIETQDVAIRSHIDSQRLMQVLMNLLLNAVEATSGKGDITLRLYRTDETIFIEVHDSGPGLDHDQEMHLFEAFYTTKTDGTGLGLAVSRELVREMGGRLIYKGGYPGATFAIELPAVANA